MGLSFFISFHKTFYDNLQNTGPQPLLAVLQMSFILSLSITCHKNIYLQLLKCGMNLYGTLFRLD